MNRARMITRVAATQRAMWFSVRWQNWKVVAGAVLTNTGMSAIHLVTTVFLKPGDLLVAPHDCYGGSYRLFDSLAKRGCYRVLFVDQGDEQALRAALAEKPKLVLVESPSNPLLRVVDIAKICHLAREVGAVSVVDNTFLSPALQNPLALGVDLVLHSCTKYLNGHSDVVKLRRGDC